VWEDVATYLITKFGGASKVIPIENKSELPFIKQQLGIRNSDIYGYDYIILLEGDSEETVFDILLPSMGHNQIRKEVRLLNLKGKDNLKKLRHSLFYIKNLDTKVFIVIDKDEVVENELNDYIREAVLEKDHFRMWPKDFEDLFESQMIISAMQKYRKKKSSNSK
jgi:OLD-like protein